jgi:hypothetical protein
MSSGQNPQSDAYESPRASLGAPGTVHGVWEIFFMTYIVGYVFSSDDFDAGNIHAYSIEEPAGLLGRGYASEELSEKSG